MHKRILILINIAILILLITGCFSNGNMGDIQQEESYIAVEIETLKPRFLYIENILSAKVYANKDVYVIPTYIGEVEEVKVEIGDIVSKDDILFLLNKEEIEKQIDQARTAYEAARANYDMTFEQIESAKKQYERTKELYIQGAVSQIQYEQAELAASDAPLQAASKGLEQAQLAYNQAQDALKNVEVKAPISGTITSIDIEAGEFATNSQPSMVIMDMENVIVQFGITENLINKVVKGDTVLLEISSADFNEEAVIESVSSSVDMMTGLYNVKVKVKNNGKIKPGMFTKVMIKTDIKENVLAVKSEAVVERGGENCVYVANGEYTVEKKVETGLDTGMYIEIISGLTDGEKVIIKGQNYVSNGSKIKVVRGE